MNMIEEAKKQIDALVRGAYAAAVGKGLLPAGAELKGTTEIPKDPGHGDYACSYAMSAAKAMHMAPRKIAETLAGEIDFAGSWFDSVEVAGAGFLNFRLGDAWYAQVLRTVEAEGQDYGSVDEGHGKKVMVEFVSANPTGTMTIGNARGGVLGDAMASILAKAGWQVWREFYVNDAGNQVELFARSVEARYIQLLKGEDAVEFPEDGYHGDDIREIARLFREQFGDEWLDKPEEERRDKMRVFGIEYNIAKMKRDLERYGIIYDQWFRESSLHESGYVKETVDLLEKQGYTYEKDGALWFKLTELGAEKDEVLRRSNGFYTYFAVDMAYHRNKFIERGFDSVINVWGADHHGHAIRFANSHAAGEPDAGRAGRPHLQAHRPGHRPGGPAGRDPPGRRPLLLQRQARHPSGFRYGPGHPAGQRESRLLCAVCPRPHLLPHRGPGRRRAPGARGGGNGFLPAGRGDGAGPRQAAEPAAGGGAPGRAEL